MKRILMYFCSYNRDSQKSLSKYLDKLQNDELLNFELCEVLVNGHNPIVDTYKVTKIPTFIMLEKVVGKDSFVEKDRLVGITGKSKILNFIKKGKGN